MIDPRGAPAAADATASGNSVDFRRLAASISAIAVGAAPSTYMLVVRSTLKGAPVPIVIDAGNGTSCGAARTGRTGGVAVGAQASPIKAVARESVRVSLWCEFLRCVTPDLSVKRVLG